MMYELKYLCGLSALEIKFIIIIIDFITNRSLVCEVKCINDLLGIYNHLLQSVQFRLS